MGGSGTYHSRDDIESDSGVKRGVKTARINSSKDAAVPFGHCCLSLAKLVDPVATPSGHVYSKEVLLTYMLTKSREWKAQKAAFEEHQAAAKAAEKAAAEQTATEKVEAFTRANGAFAESHSNDSATEEFLAPKRKLDHKELQIQRNKVRKKDTRSEEEKLNELSVSSPWITRFTPSAAEKAMTEPPKRPGSPITGKKLKASQFIPISLEYDNDTPICTVSKAVITYQPVVLIKPSGAVVLKKVFEEVIEPSNTCPVTNQNLGKKDVLLLHSSAAK
mmetsp:Transcript_11062/g.19511  ORF Transcript_11062/g.19511 Transcript_11062/m.19511 type:complete len:276 (+) Transcript_11062:223-1050(+)